MAYKVELATTCDSPYCSRPAKWRVCNRFNAEIGKFCLQHANERVDELDRAERWLTTALAEEGQDG